MSEETFSTDAMDENDGLAPGDGQPTAHAENFDPKIIVDTSNDTIRHQLRGMYQSWFLDYASYVILERAVPNIEDGLKPVQRRILHSMKLLDDGRFNKVANIVGNTMQFHPHGDASIYEALVQLGQKELLVETQGNWGNTLQEPGQPPDVTSRRASRSSPSTWSTIPRLQNGPSATTAARKSRSHSR